MNSSKLCPECFQAGHIVRLNKDLDAPGVPHSCPACNSAWANVSWLRVAWKEAMKELSQTPAGRIWEQQEELWR